MTYSRTMDFDDMQVLLRFGNGRLVETAFLLLEINDADSARQWLASAPVSDAEARSPLPETSLQIAFSARGLAAIGVETDVIDGFSDEFIIGMSGEPARSRRLGDTGTNAPENWDWGGDPQRTPDALLMLYADADRLPAWREQVTGPLFDQAFTVLAELPTDTLEATEPFGFADGISQPQIDWQQGQSTDAHARADYSNWLSAGDVVLGYPNEYGLYTTRPLIDPLSDPGAEVLPDAEDEPGRKDFGRNGCYLVIRQLQQDVPAFWRFIDRAAGSDPRERESLAAGMVGRQRDGTPLAAQASRSIPGMPADAANNQFTYAQDPAGNQCPVGAHIRRTNPRSGDFPPGARGLFSRLVRALGFGIRRPEADLIAASRFHRLLRRGRNYGPKLLPDDAVRPDAPVADRGLQFICLVGNISRQFEFVQNAWISNSKFGGVQDERDPLLGTRDPIPNPGATDHFSRPDPSGPTRRTCALPQFVTVKGGGYFFLPGLRALRYLANLEIGLDGPPR